MNCCNMPLAGSMRAEYFEVPQTPSWPSHPLAVGPLGMGFPSVSMKRISPKSNSRTPDSISARSPTTTQTVLSGLAGCGRPPCRVRAFCQPVCG